MMIECTRCLQGEGYSDASGVLGLTTVACGLCAFAASASTPDSLVLRLDSGYACLSLHL